ncbi:unnamed protein product [Sphagnum jensenii]
MISLDSFKIRASSPAKPFFALEPEERTEVLYAVGEILLSIVNGLSSIEALRDKVNNASTEGMPPCLPHELLALKPRDVVQLVLKFHDRLLASWNQNAIDLIVDQHKKLLNVVIKELRLQGLVTEFDIDIVHRPGRRHGNVDGLTRAYEGMGDVSEDDDFSDATIMSINAEEALEEYREIIQYLDGMRFLDGATKAVRTRIAHKS